MANTYANQSYQRIDWKTGDIITQPKMNKIDNYLESDSNELMDSRTGLDYDGKTLANYTNTWSSLGARLDSMVTAIKIIAGHQTIQEMQAADIEYLNSLIVARSYNSAQSYVPGEYVLYQGYLYKCTYATSGEFNPLKWERTVVSDELVIAHNIIETIDVNSTNVAPVNRKVALTFDVGDGLSYTNVNAGHVRYYIGNQQVVTSMIKDANVTTAKLEDACVVTAKIADLNVTTAKINNSAVTTEKINNSAVTTAKISDAAVTTDKINDAAVVTAKIADANVTTAKIKDLNVTEDKLATNSVTTSKIKDANVTTAKILDGNVTNAKLQHPTFSIGDLTIHLGDSITVDQILAALSLSNAMHFIGVTALTDAQIMADKTIDPQISDYDFSNAEPGDVIMDADGFEWVWTKANQWERLGGNQSYKILQSAVEDATVVTPTMTTFVAKVVQNANGNITYTKANLPVASTSVTGIARLQDDRTDTTSDNLAATPGLVYDAINYLSNTTDAADAAKYISQINVVNGQLQIERVAFNPTITLVDGTASDGPKFTFTIGNNNTSTQVEINKATTSAYGVTQLSSAIDSTSEAFAATSKAVKDAYDLANAAVPRSKLMGDGDVITIEHNGSDEYHIKHKLYVNRDAVLVDEQTPAFGESAQITEMVSDTTGHVTAKSTKTIVVPNTTFHGVTALDTTHGSIGLVPAPTAADTNRVLSSSGEWIDIFDKTALPAATPTSIGGVKIGDGVYMDVNDHINVVRPKVLAIGPIEINDWDETQDGFKFELDGFDYVTDTTKAFVEFDNTYYNLITALSVETSSYTAYNGTAQGKITFTTAILPSGPINVVLTLKECEVVTE